MTEIIDDDDNLDLANKGLKLLEADVTKLEKDLRALDTHFDLFECENRLCEILVGLNLYEQHGFNVAVLREKVDYLLGVLNSIHTGSYPDIVFPMRQGLNNTLTQH